MVLGFIRRDREVDDEVGRVPSGGEHASSLGGAVDGAQVVREIRAFVRGGWLEMEHRRVCEEHLRVALHQRHLLVAPLATLEEHPVAVRAVLGFGREVAVRGHRLEVEHHRVDRKLVLARVVLEHAGEKRVREEKPGDPKLRRRALVDPLLEGVQAPKKLGDVRPEGFETGVGLLGPHRGDLPVVHGVAERVEVARHHDATLERQTEILDGAVNHRQKTVETHQLLAEHGVHGLEVLHGVFVVGVLDVENGRDGRFDLRRHLRQRLLLGLAAARARVPLRQQDGIEQQIRLLLILRDVRVGVQPEHLGVRRDGQLTEVLEVLLVLPLGRRVEDAAGRKLVLLGHDVDVERPAVVVGEDGHEGSSIVAVRHASTVVTLAHEVDQGLKRRGQGLVGAGLVEEHPQLTQRDFQIRIVEAVRDVPTERSEVLALLDEGVEEGETHEELLPLRRSRASVEKVAIGDGIVGERLHHVRAQPLGRLVGHLDAVLQHRHGEVRGRIRGEP